MTAIFAKRPFLKGKTDVRLSRKTRAPQRRFGPGIAGPRLLPDAAYRRPVIPLPSPRRDAQAREAFSALHGFDQPLYIQFFNYLGDLLHLDFGELLRQNRSAMEVALEAFPQTLKLAVLAIFLAGALALVVGSLAAARPGSLFDRFASLVSLAGASAPDFWVAIVGILVFAVSLDLLPTSGTGSAAHWIMPVGVLMLRPFGLLVQVVRGTMIGALSSPYVKTARAKGVRRQKIIFSHALRNSLLPVITVAGDLADQPGQRRGRRRIRLRLARHRQADDRRHHPARLRGGAIDRAGHGRAPSSS